MQLVEWHHNLHSYTNKSYNSVRVPTRYCKKCPSITMSPGRNTYAVYDAIAMKANKKQSVASELRS